MGIGADWRGALGECPVLGNKAIRPNGSSKEMLLPMLSEEAGKTVGGCKGRTSTTIGYLANRALKSTEVLRDPPISDVINGKKCEPRTFGNRTQGSDASVIDAV